MTNVSCFNMAIMLLFAFSYTQAINVCDAQRQVFQDSSCCGEGNGEAFCSAKSVDSILQNVVQNLKSVSEDELKVYERWPFETEMTQFKQDLPHSYDKVYDGCAPNADDWYASGTPGSLYTNIYADSWTMDLGLLPAYIYNNKGRLAGAVFAVRKDFIQKDATQNNGHYTHLLPLNTTYFGGAKSGASFCTDQGGIPVDKNGDDVADVCIWRQGPIHPFELSLHGRQPVAGHVYWFQSPETICDSPEPPVRKLVTRVTARHPFDSKYLQYGKTVATEDRLFSPPAYSKGLYDDTYDKLNENSPITWSNAQLCMAFMGDHATYGHPFLPYSWAVLSKLEETIGFVHGINLDVSAVETFATNLGKSWQQFLGVDHGHASGELAEHVESESFNTLQGVVFDTAFGNRLPYGLACGDESKGDEAPNYVVIGGSHGKDNVILGNGKTLAEHPLALSNEKLRSYPNQRAWHNNSNPEWVAGFGGFPPLENAFICKSTPRLLWHVFAGGSGRPDFPSEATSPSGSCRPHHYIPPEGMCKSVLRFRCDMCILQASIAANLKAETQSEREGLFDGMYRRSCGSHAHYTGGYDFNAQYNCPSTYKYLNQSDAQLKDVFTSLMQSDAHYNATGCELKWEDRSAGLVNKTEDGVSVILNITQSQESYGETLILNL